MAKYLLEVRKFEKHFKNLEIKYIPRRDNAMADYLSKLGEVVSHSVIPARYVLDFKVLEVLLELADLEQVLGHGFFGTLVLLVVLLHDELRVATDNEVLDTKRFASSKSGQ